MSVFDDTFHVLEDSRWRRLKRDLRLILWLTKFAFRFFTAGSKARRQYKINRRNGEPIYMD